MQISDELFQQMNRELLAAGHPPEIHPGIDTAILIGDLQQEQFQIDILEDIGEATFATPPFTTRVYGSRAFFLAATKRA